MIAIRAVVIAASLIATLPVLAQSSQDHEAHDPADRSSAQSPQPAPPQAATPSPGMMGGNMMGGDSMMRQSQTGSRGAMPMMNMMMRERGSEHLEGRLAFIRAELKITDAQMPQWTAFAEAVRNNANSISEMRNAMMSQSGGSATLPDRLALEDKMVTAHLSALKKIEDAVGKLYGVLSDDQKKVADGIIIGPMGMPMGMM